MDESTLGSLRHRVPILDGEYFHEWKNEMLVIFNEYHLNKYITSPCAPHVDPMRQVRPPMPDLDPWRLPIILETRSCRAMRAGTC